MRKTPRTRQITLFSILFLMGANLLIGCSYRARQDSWISLLFSICGLLVWAAVLARISQLCPNSDILDLLRSFPKVLSVPLTALVVCYCFGQAVLIVRTYAGFAQMISLQNTDLAVILLLLCLSVWFFLKREDGVLYRFSYVASLPVFGLIVLVFLLLLPKFRTELLFPVFYKNTDNVIRCSLENITFPFGNAFLLLGLLSFPDRKANRRAWLSVCGIAGGLSLVILCQDLLLLGGTLGASLDFPYNFSTSLINVSDFFSRLEVFSSLFFFLIAIVRCSYLMKFVSKGVGQLTHVSMQSVSLPLVLFLGAYSLVAFRNTDGVFRYLSVFSFFAPFLQFGLPLILWIRAEISVRKTLKGRISDSVETIERNL